jgi:hypothetical protein
MKLLNIDANPKTVKGQIKGYLTCVLYLAPWKLSGYQVCSMAEIAGCIRDCLNTAGRGGMARLDADILTVDGHSVKLNAIQKARIARTRLFMENREEFMQQLVKEIVLAKKMADRKNLTLAVRLNGTSDIRWEDVRFNSKTIFEIFSELQFYDYTKIPNRQVKSIKNYHLTFSHSARPEFQKILEKALAHYGNSINLAVVFTRKKLPSEFLGREVINADESDLRFIDPVGKIAGLIAKGFAKKSNSGFSFS